MLPDAYLAVVGALPDAVLLADGTGLVHANGLGVALLRAVGVLPGCPDDPPPPHGVLTSVDLAGCVAEDDRALLVTALRSAADGRPVPAAALTFRRPDGTPEPVDCSFSPISLGDATYVLVLGRRRGCDQSGQAPAEARLLQHLALHDVTTGLGNRALLEQRLASLLSRRDGERSGLAVLFVDVDGFERINDALGHAVGDRVLQIVARRVRDAVRPADAVVRWGGDEFVVLLEGPDASAEALRVARRVERAVAAPVEHRGNALVLSASVGVALAAPGERHLPSELLQQADAAMYRAKHAGRNQHAVFDQGLRDAASRRVHVAALLREAVDGDRLVLHYQPLVDLRTRAPVGMEALLRLRDDAGLLGPEGFLDVAQESGLMRRVSHAVLREACRQGGSWVAAGHDICVNVNVCAQQVEHVEEFEDQVQAALADAGLPADRLVCEVTEHALLDVGERTVAGLRRLRDSGVTFSVDDFGTGHGSMTYLQTLPVGEIKIDRRFVARAGHDRPAAAIVRAVAGLAAELGMRCVAEGVEDELHHELALSLGASLGQGYLYAAPAAAAHATELLNRHRA